MYTCRHRMSCATSSIPVIINGDIYKLGIGHAWGRAWEECGGEILCLKQIILKYVRVVVSLFSEASVDGWVDIFPCREATLLLWLLFYRHFYELL